MCCFCLCIKLYTFLRATPGKVNKEMLNFFCVTPKVVMQLFIKIIHQWNQCSLLDWTQYFMRCSSCFLSLKVSGSHLKWPPRSKKYVDWTKREHVYRIHLRDTVPTPAAPKQCSEGCHNEIYWREVHPLSAVLNCYAAREENYFNAY